MLTLTLVFVLAAATIVVLVWTGAQIFQEQDDPVADRLSFYYASSYALTAPDGGSSVCIDIRKGC